MKPWDRQDTDWISRYAARSITLKLQTISEPILLQATTALGQAFKRVYRAVAFDIDGTLTIPGSDLIDAEMARLVGRLLQRGVPVVLITGRGTGGTRAAATAIRDHNRTLTDWYFRRLQCVTHNGVTILRTPTDSPAAFLSEDLLIGQEKQNVETLRKFAQDLLAKEPLGPCEITREPHSVRVALSTAADQERAEFVLRPAIAADPSLNDLFITRGTYRNLHCLDLAWTNKRIALEYIAQIMGIAPDRILRIGDQGQDGGNDYDLLNSPAGFSVSQFSSRCDVCHPVLDESLTVALTGVEATRLLLNTVLLFPPLSLSPTAVTERVRSLRRFERLALLRSREETLTITQRLRGRLHYLLVDTEAFSTAQTLEIADIFDSFSGAVKMRDWELDELPESHPANALFGFRLLPWEPTRPRPQWAMYSDTGILLRGAAYYTALTTQRGPDSFDSYFESAQQFLALSHITLDALLNDKRDLIRYKLVLGIQDNVRNILLQALYSFFIIEAETSDAYTVTRELFSSALLSHTDEFLRFLLDPEPDWHSALVQYKIVLSAVATTLAQCLTALQASLTALAKIDIDHRRQTELFKWRECDHFLQNFAAINLGFHEFRQRSDVRALDEVGVVGLAYGGSELPALAYSVAKRRGVTVVPFLAKVSTYGDPAVESQIRAGEDQYATELLLRNAPICCLKGDQSLPNLPLIILDDNCTTGVTLQLARDVLVRYGADVIGAIIVRFPTANRHIHMTINGRGFVDPEVLFSFIRGLIAPSPYSRLGEGTGFVDETGVFDKSKDRIKRYLKKNYTPPLDTK